MLTFKNTNIFFSALLTILIIVHIINGIPVIIYPLFIIIYSLIVFYGCYYIGSNFFMPVICSAKTYKKEIALSFDDGPVNNFTPQILEILKRENAPATFFCIGNRISGNENIIQQINNEGHIIGNHSYSHHFWFDMYSANKMLADLQKMDAEVEKVIGLRPKLFRPPYGVMNPNVKKAIIRGGYIPIGWSIRSLDTIIKDDRKLLKKVVASIKPGAIFLFHDTSKTTFTILPEFIQEVKNKGYIISRLDKMLSLQPYA